MSIAKQARVSPRLIACITLVLASLACTFPFTSRMTPTPSPETVPSPEATTSPEESSVDEAEMGGVTMSPSPEEGECTYGAHYVADITIPDGSDIAAGDSFNKTWRIENTGCLDWPAGTKLFFVQGDQMSGPASVEVPATAAGGQQDVTVSLVGPSGAGEYRGYWQLKSPDGILFGPQFYVDIIVVALPQQYLSPDLVITGIEPSTTIQAGNPFTITMRVVNQGDQVAAASSLSCEILGQGIDQTKPVWALEPGESMLVSCNYTLSEGDYTFRAGVDSGNVVDEGDETNNSRDYVFTAHGQIVLIPTFQLNLTMMMPLFQPDLTVTSLVIINGQHIQAQVMNQGNGTAPATSLNCNVFTSGMQFHSQENVPIGSLGPGDSTGITCYYNLPIPVSSISAISAVIDPGGLITESNETNNARWTYP